jgi:2-polyprenyl-3-methyl-5-hydroxy-6-metoxy-1,4-benzoquinol methylase
MIATTLRRARGYFRRLRPVDAALEKLYEEVHDLDEARELRSTAEAFGRQWAEHPTGEYLLSDPWFRANVARILADEELRLPREWFKEKRVLDAGCGNGRWSYGFAELGCIVTAIDVNEAAVAATARAVPSATVLLASLEEFDLGQFDLVFCWGVLHHVVHFKKAFDRLVAAVADHGLLYLYLYGRGSVPIADDMALFRDRVAYNMRMTDEERRAFLLRKARGDVNRVHNMHDIYAPLINRRFEFAEVAGMLEARSFTDIVPTIKHTEVFVRASRHPFPLTPPSRGPYWFEPDARKRRSA